MSVDYLEKLNPGQRRAVEHGVGEAHAVPSAPLLVIAGAGTGKTNTLAHRVAHLIVNGTDPRRILLIVLVDEYQDTNRLQASILLALKPTGHGLTVVGDDAQAIYSFRAATVRNILDFPTQFSPPASIITLDQNYRSTQAILAAANGVIDLARERFTKNLWTDRSAGSKPQLVTVRDEADQARCIVERVL